MSLRNSPEAGNNGIVSKGATKLTQLAAALAMLTAATSASAADARKIGVDCGPGRHAEEVSAPGAGSKEYQCVEDGKGAPAKKARHAARPKSEAMCYEDGPSDAVETLPQPNAAINTLGKVKISAEGKYEIQKGQIVELRVNCFDTIDGGKTGKDIEDPARRLAVARSLIRISVNDHVVTPTAMKLDGGDVLISLDLPEASTNHVVLQSSGDQRNYTVVVAKAPAAVVDKKDEPKKDEPKKDEPKKDEPKKDEPKKDEPKKDEPKKDEPTSTSHISGGLSYVAFPGHRSSMVAAAVKGEMQAGDSTILGLGLEVGRERERETVINGRQVSGVGTTHIFPSAQFAIGDIERGLLAQLRVGPDFEISDKIVLPDTIHGSDKTAALRGEIGVGGTVALMQRFALRVMVTAGLMTGGQDKVGEQASGTRFTAGALMDVFVNKTK